MASSSKRLLSELVGRIRLMSERGDGVLFTRSRDQDSRHILWLVICRRYQFIKEFYQQTVQSNWISLKETCNS